jgi:hypothetical protein
VSQLELNESIYSYLTSLTAITNLVSTRIYPDRVSQKSSYTYPYITYELVSEEPVDTFIMQNNVLFGATYQFNVWGESRSSVRNVSKQIFKAFKNLKGKIGGINGVTLSAVEPVMHMTDLETDNNGNTIAYGDIQEFQIWHYETA